MDDMRRRESARRRASTRSRSAIVPSTTVSRGSGGSDLAPAGREIVDDENLVALRQLMLDQVRAEAARAAGNQNPHRVSVPAPQMRVAALHAVLAGSSATVARDDLVERRELDLAEVAERAATGPAGSTAHRPGRAAGSPAPDNR